MLMYQKRASLTSTLLTHTKEMIQKNNLTKTGIVGFMITNH